MLRYTFLILSGILFSAQLFAFQCYFTLVKDNCWSDYDVTVNVVDVSNNNTVLTITAPKGQAWVRQSFTCQPSQEFIYKATFAPYIWQSEKGNVYTATNYWTLPKDIKPGTSAWEIPVCYPKAFSSVPLPPQATNNCACDFSKIPPIPPKKLN